MVDVTIKKKEQDRGTHEGQEASAGLPSPPDEQPVVSSAVPRPFVPHDVVAAGLVELLRRCAENMGRVSPGAGVPWNRPPASAIWFPPIEVSEEHGYFTVCVELPGLKKDDISVALTEEGLVLSGHRKPADPERVQGIHRSERSYGSFCRTIPIPDDADIEKTTATFEHGLLTVSIPVPEGSHWRREVPVGP